MAWNNFGARLDTGVAGVAERTLRRVSRRQALRAAVVGGAASVATMAMGQRPALAAADKCSANCGPTARCKSCPQVGCPKGYSLCRFGNGKNGTHSNCCNNAHHAGCCNSPCCSCSNGVTCKCPCVYPNGYWVACSGLGSFGHGYELCQDCLKGNNGKNCGSWCTCLSACICCNCTTPHQVRAEAKRVQDILQAQVDLVAAGSEN